MTLDDILIDRYVFVVSTRNAWAYFCRGRIVAFDLDASTVKLFIEKDFGDCAFITFFIHEVELVDEEPRFAEPIDGWTDHKCDDLSAIAHLYPPQPVTRPLSSLTDEEINTCYKQAMGVDYDVERVERSDLDSSITAYVGQDYLSLDERNGHVRIAATVFFDLWEYPAMVRVAAVVRYLDSIGIALGAG